MTEPNQINTMPSASTHATLASADTPVVATKATPTTADAAANKVRQPRKIFGIDLRSILTVVGLTLFFVLAMLAVLVALRQRQSAEDTRAPNAPESRPDAAVTSEGVCSVGFTVAEAGEIDCEEATFTDDFSQPTLNARYIKGGAGSATIANGTLQLAIPGIANLINSDASVFIETKDKVTGDFETLIDLPATTVPSGSPASFRFAVDNLDKRAVVAWEKTAAGATTLVTQQFSRSTGQTTQRKVASSSATVSDITFKIDRVGTGVTTYYDTGSGFTEFATFTDIPGALLVQALTSNLSTPNSNPISMSVDNFRLQCPEEITYACNSSCETDAQCQTADADFVCDETSNTCRLGSNPISVTCEAEEVTYACNSSCETDAQCQTVNDDYVCQTDGDQKYCRLGSNTSSTTCAVATYSCNSLCTSNAQCQGVDEDYICAEVGDEKRCRLQEETTSMTCQPPEEEVTYSCNSLCTSNAECQTADEDYICAEVGDEKRCRLENNSSSTTCQAAAPEPSPTPTVGCNQTCASNADCSNADHICFDDVCRLGTNPTNAACAPAVTPTPASAPIVQVSPQPELPEQLPETGAEDIARWLVPGVGALLLGALALFFL